MTVTLVDNRIHVKSTIVELNVVCPSSGVNFSIRYFVVVKYPVVKRFTKF